MNAYQIGTHAIGATLLTRLTHPDGLCAAIVIQPPGVILLQQKWDVPRLGMFEISHKEKNVMYLDTPEICTVGCNFDLDDKIWDLVSEFATQLINGEKVTTLREWMEENVPPVTY